MSSRETRDMSGDNPEHVLPSRGKIGSILADNPDRVRTPETVVNKRSWADLAKMLASINPDYTQIVLDKLSAIDPKADAAEKTEKMMLILAQYSLDTEAHCDTLKRMIEEEGKLADRPEYAAFRGIDFSKFAEAMERHDIGKLGMPKHILDPATGMLYGEQERVVKEKHPIIGSLILKKLGFDINSQRLALTHHLRYKTEGSGAVVLSGYPREDFVKFCSKNSLPVQLNPEDHLAAFTDVFTALTDKKHRRSNVHGMVFGQSDMELCLQALEKMSTNKSPDLFADDFYQKG